MNEVMSFTKRFLFASMICLAFSCEENLSPGRIVVFVHFDKGEAGKRIEVVETGETKYTDSNGLVEFQLLPGRYTVRAYNINHSGPMYEYIDQNIEVKTGDTVNIDIFDCPYCA